MLLRSAATGAFLLGLFGLAEWTLRAPSGTALRELALGWLTALALYVPLGGALGVPATVLKGWERPLRRVASPTVFATCFGGLLLLGGVRFGSAATAALGAAVAIGAATGRPSRAVASWSAIAVAAAGLALLARPRRLPAPAAPADSPAVLLVTIDTLRADRVGVYGYERANTPVIDGLARRGRLYREVYGHTTVTGPSHLTILSGLTPFDHGVILNGTKAPADLELLPELFSAAGYPTAGVVSGYPVTNETLGIGDRFDYFDDELRLFSWIPPRSAERAMAPSWVDSKVNQALGQLPREPVYRPAERTTQAALRYLKGVSGAPFFLWVHYFDPHAPYRPPDRFRTAEALTYQGPGEDGRVYSQPGLMAKIRRSPEARRYLRDLYDAEVAYVDEQLGLLVEGARAAAPKGELAIVVASDHGEDFGEHGPVISRDLFDTTLHTPLIVVEPPSRRAAPQVVDGQIGLEQTAAMVLDAAGLEPSDADSQQEIEAVARVAKVLCYGLRTSGWKLIQRLPEGEEPRLELYDLDRDPVELTDVSDERPDLVAALFSRLSPRIEARGGGEFEDPELTPKQIKILEGLGYIQ